MRYLAITREHEIVSSRTTTRTNEDFLGVTPEIRGSLEVKLRICETTKCLDVSRV